MVLPSMIMLAALFGSVSRICVMSKFLGIGIPLETRVSVTREQMESVHKLLNGRKNLTGLYGDDFLNNW